MGIKVQDGFVVADGQALRFRRLENGVPVWTDDIKEALQFLRRKDADSFSEEDEDAWLILPVTRTRLTGRDLAWVRAKLLLLKAARWLSAFVAVACAVCLLAAVVAGLAAVAGRTYSGVYAYLVS